MISARELVRDCLDTPELLDGIGDTDDLIASGVGSGDLLRLVLGCEDTLGRALTERELDGLDSIRAVHALLAEAEAPDVAG